MHVHVLSRLRGLIVMALDFTQCKGVFDIRQNALLQSITVHTGAVNCIVVNDVDGYFVTGSSDGDIKVSFFFFFYTLLAIV